MKINRVSIVLGVVAVGVLLGIGSAEAATVAIHSNIGGYTVTIWYGTNRNNVQPTWYDQGIWTGDLVLNGMPDGWYTWSVQSWPSGYRLASIDGASYQQGGNVSWNVTWEPTYTLTVTKFGSGSGTVTGGDRINCGNTCSAVFNSGDMIGLDASPSPGSVFAGWSEPCSGTGGCVFPMPSSNKTITATFNTTPKYTLAVTKSGSGSGTVTGAGINCGSDCSEAYDAGNCIEYFHSETKGSAWGGWSGACTGPGCVICFDSNKSLTATFLKKEPTVSISCSPGTIPYNSSANVSWSSRNTSNCTVSPTGWTGKSGSQSTGNLTSSQTYTVTCTGE